LSGKKCAERGLRGARWECPGSRKRNVAGGRRHAAYRFQQGRTFGWKKVCRTARQRGGGKRGASKSHLTGKGGRLGTGVGWGSKQKEEARCRKNCQLGGTTQIGKKTSLRGENSCQFRSAERRKKVLRKSSLIGGGNYAKTKKGRQPKGISRL